VNESETEPPVEILQKQTQDGIKRAEQAINQLHEMDSQAATPASPPVQDQSAKPASQESLRVQQTPPSATAGSPSGNGSAATPSMKAESDKGPHERAVEQQQQRERALEQELGLREQLPSTSPDIQKVRDHADRLDKMGDYAERQIARYLDGKITTQQVLDNVAREYPEVRRSRLMLGRWTMDFVNKTLSGPVTPRM